VSGVVLALTESLVIVFIFVAFGDLIALVG
jgi:hypothetical protein